MSSISFFSCSLLTEQTERDSKNGETAEEHLVVCLFFSQIVYGRGEFGFPLYTEEKRPSSKAGGNILSLSGDDGKVVGRSTEQKLRITHLYVYLYTFKRSAIAF